jgi:CP family cyanate transporter-like MFS transporter
VQRLPLHTGQGDGLRSVTPLVDSHAAARPLPRVWLITALFLVGMNLRPALSSVAPLLDDIRTAIGLTSAGAGLLTTLPVVCFGVFAPLLAARYSEDRAILSGLIALAAGIGIRIFFGSHGMFAGTLIAGLSTGVIMILLPGIVKRDFPKQAPRCRSSS